MQPTWYQQAVIYEVAVGSFQDSSGDGHGDFRGLTSRLDYLAGLGVTCLWLLPVFKTPFRDNGYDVSDFYSIDPRWGTMEDFEAFMAEARRRGLRVLLDLPINHTSDEHPWFQAARSDRQSPFRDWYVWHDQRPSSAPQQGFRGETSVFGGEIWTYDEQTGAYYEHHFYPFQPDLNTANPTVREEIKRIMAYWLGFGIDGFRMDAVPYLIHRPGIDNPYEVARELYDVVCSRAPQGALMGEVDLDLVELRQYFGMGARADQMNMLLNHWLANYLFLALARRSSHPLTWALSMLPVPPVGGQWANFLRNHDELSLNRLTPLERDEVMRAFAPHPHMAAYGRGPRRRLATMLDGDVRRVKQAHSLLLSMPGTPILYYGDEIGMGDDLTLAEREAVRSPMQWSAAGGAGFSGASHSQLLRPVIADGDFRHEMVNVEMQSHREESLLNFVRRAVRARHALPEVPLGRWRVLDPGLEEVFAHSATLRGREAVFVHNLSEHEVTVRLDVHGVLEEVLADQAYGSADASELGIGPYGFRWFRLHCDATLDEDGFNTGVEGKR